MIEFARLIWLSYTCYQLLWYFGTAWLGYVLGKIGLKNYPNSLWQGVG